MKKSDQLFYDPLFKGCTRPAMLFGVPLVPLTTASALIILISIYTSILFSTLLIPLVLIMQQITKKDDQMFRLLGLKFYFRVFHRNKNKKFWKASAYSPIAFKKNRK